MYYSLNFPKFQQQAIFTIDGGNFLLEYSTIF